MAVPLISDPRNDPMGSAERGPVDGPAAGTSGTLAAFAAAAAPQRVAEAADEALAALYADQYQSLVRLSAMLVGDLGTAEEVVQGCFAGMHRAFWRLRDTDKALRYLRRSVVNRSRSVLRQRTGAGQHQQKPGPAMPSAGQVAIARTGESGVISALRALPARQREALVLSFYLDLSEEQVASAMGISRGAAATHTTRAKAALRSVLERAS